MRPQEEGQRSFQGQFEYKISYFFNNLVAKIEEKAGIFTDSSPLS